MVLQELVPKNIRSQVLTQIDRISQPITDFIRGNPIVSTAAVGIGTTALVSGIAVARRVSTKKKTTTAKRKRKRISKRHTRRKKSRSRRGKRGIIRGRGLGSREIKHTRKGTKLVSFRTKGGKMVRFKVKGTSTRRRGFKK